MENKNEKEFSSIVDENWKIVIPQQYRHTLNLQKGDNIGFILDENGVRITKIENLDKLRKQSYTSKELKKMMEKSRKEELNLEK